MIVVHSLKIVVFYINCFVQKKGTSQILSPLTIVEGTVVNFNLYFRVIFEEFVQTFKRTNNIMISRTADTIALEPNRNLQGRIRCLSLVSRKILNHNWQDVTVYKMTLNAISRINYIAKQ